MVWKELTKPFCTEVPDHDLAPVRIGWASAGRADAADVEDMDADAGATQDDLDGLGPLFGGFGYRWPCQEVA
jgi:hypothetical protein